MNVQWKEIGQKAHPRRWSGMVWGSLLLVMLCSIGTAVVGVKLYQVTAHQAGFNPK